MITAGNRVKRSGDTMAGTLGLGSNAIINVLDPVNPQDASTKKYVDDSIALIPGVGQITFSRLTPTASQTVTSGYCAYVTDFFEISSGLFLEIGSDSVFEIG